MSMLLLYFIIAIFLLYTYKNKKPVKWSEMLNVITLNIYTKSIGDIAFIPGPIRLPIIGTKWNCWFMNMNKLHEYYARLNIKYGDVVLEQQNSVNIVSLFNKEDIEKVLKYPSKYPFRPPTEIVTYYRQSRPDRYSSVGVVNAQGPEWAHLRIKLTPKTLENRKILSEFCPDLNQICDDFVIEMKAKRNANNIVIGVENILKSMSVESACCLILGKRLGLLQKKTGNEDFLLLKEASKNVFKSIRDSYYGNNLWKYLPTKVYKNYAKNESIMYEIVLKMITETLNDKEVMAVDEDKASILLTILRTEGLDIRDKISGVIDFINAGIELLSNTVSFILYFISINPEVQEKILEETSGMGEELTQEELSRAYYTRAAIYEAFRISPSAFAIARILEEDFVLSGFYLKPGTVVLCQNMIASAKDENFENASEYKPERWLTDSGEFNVNQCSSSIVLPFGCGKRICPGRKYTELELMILTIKLVRSFKIEYKSELDRQFQFVLAPKAPVNVQFCDR